MFTSARVQTERKTKVVNAFPTSLESVINHFQQLRIIESNVFNCFSVALYIIDKLYMHLKVKSIKTLYAFEFFVCLCSRTTSCKPLLENIL